MCDELEKYIKELTNAFEGIKIIWLFGSRANNRNKPLSDWDLLVFADIKTYEDIKIDEYHHRGAVDLLIVIDGNQFIKPWGEEKKGSINSWHWEVVSESEAEYDHIKFIPDKPGSANGRFEELRLKAKKIYERKI